MIETIQFQNKIYPHFQTQGFAAKFAFPFAMEVCKGEGLDIGCNRPQWAFPGALQIDPLINNKYDAYNLPCGEFDYCFSSHCLEHLRDWVEALDYWQTKLKIGGVLFLYLPAYSQNYWRSWNNRKHIHNLSPEIIEDYLIARDWKNVFVSGIDLNDSFMAIAEKS